MKLYTTTAIIQGQSVQVRMEIHAGTQFGFRPGESRHFYYDQHGRDLGGLYGEAAAVGETKLCGELQDAFDKLNEMEQDEQEAHERGGRYYRGPAAENDYDY